jgi:hypothetical protein
MWCVCELSECCHSFSLPVSLCLSLSFLCCMFVSWEVSAALVLVFGIVIIFLFICISKSYYPPKTTGKGKAAIDDDSDQDSEDSEDERPAKKSKGGTAAGKGGKGAGKKGPKGRKGGARVEIEYEREMERMPARGGAADW